MRNPVHSPIAELTPELTQVLLEYSTLSARRYLSVEQADRIREILEMANEDLALNFWVTEIDYRTGHRLGFLDENHLQDYLKYYKEQQAMLQESIATSIAYFHPARLLQPPVVKPDASKPHQPPDKPVERRED